MNICGDCGDDTFWPGKVWEALNPDGAVFCPDCAPRERERLKDPNQPRNRWDSDAWKDTARRHGFDPEKMVVNWRMPGDPPPPKAKRSRAKSTAASS